MQRFSYHWGVVIFFILSKEVHMSDLQYVTKETLEQMKIDLQRMKAVDRPAASRAIAEAREKGDLKENAEYDAAKEAKGTWKQNSNDRRFIGQFQGADESNIDTSSFYTYKVH
jgi:transcription elongation factor GreA